MVFSSVGGGRLTTVIFGRQMQGSTEHSQWHGTKKEMNKTKKHAAFVWLCANTSKAQAIIIIFFFSYTADTKGEL